MGVDGSDGQHAACVVLYTVALSALCARTAARRHAPRPQQGPAFSCFHATHALQINLSYGVSCAFPQALSGVRKTSVAGSPFAHFRAPSQPSYAASQALLSDAGQRPSAPRPPPLWRRATPRGTRLRPTDLRPHANRAQMRAGAVVQRVQPPAPPRRSRRVLHSIAVARHAAARHPSLSPMA